MCRCRTSLIGGTKKGHGKISWPNPIEVLQQNPPESCRDNRRPRRQLRAKCSHRWLFLISIDMSRPERIQCTLRPEYHPVASLITSFACHGLLDLGFHRFQIEARACLHWRKVECCLGKSSHNLLD
jgi:hypothetical protein